MQRVEQADLPCLRWVTLTIQSSDSWRCWLCIASRRQSTLARAPIQSTHRSLIASRFLLHSRDLVSAICISVSSWTAARQRMNATLSVSGGGSRACLCRDRVAGCWNLVILNGADSPSLESQETVSHELLDPDRTRVCTSDANYQIHPQLACESFRNPNGEAERNILITAENASRALCGMSRSTATDDSGGVSQPTADREGEVCRRESFTLLR